MGIPHLAHQLQPHGAKVVLSRTPATSDEKIPTIIDGPSLAYQCYYVCMSRRSGARNAYEAIPSYKELGEAAVSWLEQIEQYGPQVKAIFFDGLLPLSKKPTRLSRLQNYANQLVAFRALHKEDLPPRQAAVIFSKADLLSPTTSSTRLKALPAASFLVPAVIEALLSSVYKDITTVIPGEADAYCAETARKIGGTILTSDSDLLVHDLGAEGKVILFRDIESIHLPSKGKCLKVQQYQPSAIASRYGLSNLVRLAFFMSNDPHLSFPAAVKLAKEKNPSSEEFTDFREQYASLPVLSTLAAEYLSHSTRPVFTLLSRLDPRISELIHQISMTPSSQTPSTSSQRQLDMYLPFLLDDPTRTSSWRTSVPFRRLAYSTLRLLDPSITSIDEYERKGTRISDTPTSLYEATDLQTQISQFLTSLRQSRESALSEVLNYRLFAVKSLVETYLEAGKTAPRARELCRFVVGDQDGGKEELGWGYIQGWAQVQGFLYSLRLLVQVVGVVVAFLEEGGSASGSEGVGALKKLVEGLGRVPLLAELLDLGGLEGEREVQAVVAAVERLLKEAGVVEEVQGGREKEMTKKQRKKKRKNKEGHAVETASPAWRSGNPFAGLSQ